MTHVTQRSGNSFMRARVGEKIPDPASHTSLRHGVGWACTCPGREERPAARERDDDGELLETWLDEFEELGKLLKWSAALQRWVRPTCPVHGQARRRHG